MRTRSHARACPSDGRGDVRRGVALVGLLAWAVAGLGYPDAPPPGHTGGFGEPTCHRCHFDAPLNAAGGSLVLDGLPDAYQPGAVYPLVVRLQRPDMRRGGFQLAVRFAEGRSAGTQAGRLRAVDSTAAVAIADEVAYAQHTLAGTALDSSGVGRWVVAWEAPDTLRGTVVVHAAGNAANDDASEFGDYIYTRTWRAHADE